MLKYPTGSRTTSTFNGRNLTQVFTKLLMIISRFKLLKWYLFEQLFCPSDTVVEHSTHDPKIDGLTPANGTVREKLVKKNERI